jgi:hypothetical protein
MNGRCATTLPLNGTDDMNKNLLIKTKLNQISQNPSLRNTCLYMLTSELLDDCPDDEPVTIASSRRMLEKALDPKIHIGRTGASSMLSDFVGAGLLEMRDAELLRSVAKLVGRDHDLTIDPLLEVARQVLSLRLAAGGQHG